MNGRIVRSVFPLFGCTRCGASVYVYRVNNGICTRCVREVEGEDQ